MSFKPGFESRELVAVYQSRWLWTFEKHVMMVARSCHYHAQAIRHIRHLLSTELASTLARNLILLALPTVACVRRPIPLPD